MRGTRTLWLISSTTLMSTPCSLYIPVRTSLRHIQCTDHHPHLLILALNFKVKWAVMINIHSKWCSNLLCSLLFQEGWIQQLNSQVHQLLSLCLEVLLNSSCQECLMFPSIQPQVCLAPQESPCSHLLWILLNMVSVLLLHSRDLPFNSAHMVVEATQYPYISLLRAVKILSVHQAQPTFTGLCRPRIWWMRKWSRVSEASWTLWSPWRALWDSTSCGHTRCRETTGRISLGALGGCHRSRLKASLTERSNRRTSSWCPCHRSGLLSGFRRMRMTWSRKRRRRRISRGTKRNMRGSSSNRLTLSLMKDIIGVDSHPSKMIHRLWGMRGNNICHSLMRIRNRRDNRWLHNHLRELRRSLSISEDREKTS